jgi:hypothetical protein
MSVSSINSGSAFNWPTLSRQTNPAAANATDAGAGSPSTSTNLNGPSDSIDVSLPNGFSVDVTHLGAGGINSNLLKSLQDMVSKLEAYGSSANSVAAGTFKDATSDTGNNTATANTPNVVGIDMIHVDLPNGISVEVRHSSGNESSSQSLSAMNELVDAADELIKSFAEYSGTSAAANGTTGASTATDGTQAPSNTGSGKGNIASSSREAAAYAAALSLVGTPSSNANPQTGSTTA